MAATGQAGGDAAQGQGEAQGQGQAEAPAFDAQAITQGLESLRSDFQGFLEAAPWQAQQQQEGADQQQQADEGVDLSGLEEYGLDPNLIAGAFEQYANKATEPLAAELQQLRQQQQDARFEQEARQLVEEFPELGDQPKAQEVVQLAGELADAHFPSEMAAQLKKSPAFWRLTHMAQLAAERANEEGSGDPGAAHLEGGAGAVPGGQGQADFGEQLADAAKARGSVLPF